MNKKKKIKGLIDLFLKDEKDYPTLYSKLYKGLEDIKAFDQNCAENFRKLEGKDYGEKIAHIEDFTFENCCTFLSFILESDRVIEGNFQTAVDNGDVLNLLDQAYFTL